MAVAGLAGVFTAGVDWQRTDGGDGGTPRGVGRDEVYGRSQRAGDRERLGGGWRAVDATGASGSAQAGVDDPRPFPVKTWTAW